MTPIFPYENTKIDKDKRAQSMLEQELPQISIPYPHTSLNQLDHLILFLAFDVSNTYKSAKGTLRYIFLIEEKKKKKIGKNNQTNSRVSKMALSYNLK